ncbi:GtrA family protein [Candidatus Methylopumilus planktonicus]|uniref:GtrA family protein n=1 Tax=Candidatus Methylopumilus planktonicus TaxID=1581557 RepID=UPI00111EC4EE|nr:GtrA family protein [Candidatus Methylopumilus planktonicus]QDD01767.1 GtrA family protein [Candidatus Methylopumilus planktonicus]
MKLIDTFKKIFNSTEIRFIFVGGVNTLFGFGLYSFLIFLNFHFSLAAILSTILGILFNFKTIGVYVFFNNDKSLIFKFFLVYLIIYIMNISFISVVSKMGLSYYVAGALSTVPLAFLSYILNKNYVFNKK